jgi:hypothetical protein
MTAATEAIGESPVKLTDRYLIALQQSGITGFVDKGGRAWSLRNYGDMAVRTTSRQAAVAELLTRDDEQDLYMISKIGSTCPVCAPLEGRVYSKSGTDPNYPPLSLAFGKIDPTGPEDLSNTFLNIHPNCLVPGGSVLGEGIVAESRRLYRGEVVTLNTAGGDKITVTPNHPILTDRGFIPAGQIKEGDKVVKTTREYARLIGEAPNNVYIDSGVDEIFHALMKSSGGTSSAVKGSSEQFHGDGIADEEVNIIFSDSLGNGIGNLMRVKKLRKKSFPSGWGRRILLFADSTFTKIFVSALRSLYSGVRRLGFVGGIKLVSKDSEEFPNLGKTAPAFLGYLRICKTGIVEIKHFCEKLRMGFLEVFRDVGKLSLTGSPHYSEFRADSGHLMMSDPVFFGNLCEEEPAIYERLKFLFTNGAAVFESVNHIDTSYYDGYVYNFETKLNYYVYNNIVTHNCLHSLMPYTELGKTPKQVERIRNFSNPETNPLDRDPRSKKQIEAYREKERNRAAYLREFKKKQEKRLERQMAKQKKATESEV